MNIENNFHKFIFPVDKKLGFRILLFVTLIRCSHSFDKAKASVRKGRKRRVSEGDERATEGQTDGELGFF